MIKPKSIKNRKMWAYFAPDGWLQVRSLGETKAQARKYLTWDGVSMDTWQDYEHQGFTLHQVIVKIEVLA